ncbi:MAG: hypothetical protein HKN26_15225 [Acidimicrobiales bacterium]|nr:hypothetical protein [Acidimicrobiales bacterium]
MKTKIIAALLAGFMVTGVSVGTAAAAKPAADGIACMKAGQDTLRDLDLFQAAAQGQIDYSTLADPVEGPIFAALPEGSFLPINEVFALHRSSPGLFAWCGGS